FHQFFQMINSKPNILFRICESHSTGFFYFEPSCKLISKLRHQLKKTYGSGGRQNVGLKSTFLSHHSPNQKRRNLKLLCGVEDFSEKSLRVIKSGGLRFCVQIL